VSPRPTGLDRVGNLKRPRIARTQVFVDYTTVRGGLPSPLEGAVAGQILKVDLALMLAQLFDIGFDGRLLRAQSLRTSAKTLSQRCEHFLTRRHPNVRFRRRRLGGVTSQSA
jgi:hypothetical protein